MTRQEALDILKRCIPSFNREYMHCGEVVDKEQDRSWLYRDELKWDKGNNLITYPEVIPADYMTGIKANVNGKDYESVSCRNTRKIGLSITDFGLYGNTHKYGELKVSGVQWRDLDDGFFTWGTLFVDIEPRALPTWSVDLFKIISDQDNQKMDDWDTYDPHESTQRFESLAELYCTAAYVSLLRYQGPILLYVGESYVSPQDQNRLLTVDENDNVVLHDELNRAIKEMLP